MDADPYLSILNLLCGITPQLGENLMTVHAPTLESVIALIIAVMSLMVSAFISGSETAFFSLTEADIESVDNDQKQERIRQLLAKPERLLATILIANNLVNVAIVVLCNFVMSQVFEFRVEWLDFLFQTVVLTFLLLLFGEILPKLYSNSHNVQWAKFAINGIVFFSRLFGPASRLMAMSTSVVNRVVTKKSDNLSLDDLSGEFIAKACALRLAPEAEARLWDKINAAVNRGLTSSRGLEINKAIAVAGYILQSDGQRLQLTPESSKWITCTILFGSPSYLGKVVNSSNIDVVLYITDRGLIPSEDSFFDALNQSHSTTVWRKMLRYYYDDINDNIGIIINRIMQWPVPPEARHELIGELFPVERCGNALYGYILAHTEQISDLKEMVRAVCLRADKERFSAILKQSGNDAVVAGVLAPIVAEYYAGMVSHDPRNGIKALLEFIDEVTVPVFNGMEAARRVFDVYADACMKNPAGCDRDVLGRLLPPSEIAVGHEAAAKIATVASLMDGNVPSMVDCSVLLMAHRMGKDAGYIRQLYEAWLKLSPSRKEVAAYASQAAGMAAACVAGIISATWESQVQAIRADRENYVLAIADNVKWNSTDRKAFIASCPDKALAKHLAGADKFFTKLTRKLFNRS